MGIIVEKIQSKYIGRYAYLALEEQIHRAKYRNVTTAVAFLDDGDKKDGAGLIQYVDKKNVRELLWIFVPEDNRDCGVGKRLLEYMFEDTDEHGKRVFTAKVTEELQTGFDSGSLAEFLLHNGFDDEKTIPGPWLISGKDVFLENFRLKQKQLDAISRAVTPFSACTPTAVSACVRALNIEDNDSILYAEKTLSYIYESGGRYKGIIWSVKIGDTLYPEVMIFEDESVRDMLLAAFFDGYSKNIHFADRIIVENTDISREWIPKFFPGMKSSESVSLSKKTVHC